jgi:hypothetical protein
MILNITQFEISWLQEARKKMTVTWGHMNYIHCALICFILFLFLMIVVEATETCLFVCFVCFWRDSSQWTRASSFTRFLDHTQRRSTVGRTPLDEWSARRRDLYLTTYNSYNKITSKLQVFIRTHDLSRQTAADLRLRPRGHWDRLGDVWQIDKSNLMIVFQTLKVCVYIRVV